MADPQTTNKATKQPEAPLLNVAEKILKMVENIARRIEDSRLLFAIVVLLLICLLVTSIALVGGTSDSQFIFIVVAMLVFALIVLTIVSLLNRVRSDVDAIRLALRGILMKHEFGPLKALEGPGQAEIKKEPNLITYLHRLDGLNFIQPQPGYLLNNIAELRDDETFDLKKYLHITEDGKTYLKITTQLEIFKPGVDWHDPYPWTPLPRSR